MTIARAPVISEENGFWVVRVLAPADELVVQEYRCASEDVARAFASMLGSDKRPPAMHGAVSRARRMHQPWWRGRRPG
jgi:hypothetical protein